MSLMKRWGEELSIKMGHGGAITPAVINKAQKLQKLYAKQRKVREEAETQINFSKQLEDAIDISLEIKVEE